jgi:GNAT superfamily N-acetyltransferase
MLEIRQATAADAGLLTAHRKAMFLAMGHADDASIETMSRSFEPWVRRLIGADKYLAWVAEDVGHPVASAGLLILDWPPQPLDPAGEHRGYLFNVFVEQDYRRRGIAKSLVERCMTEARRRSIRVVVLHASNAGAPMYEALGFGATNEMLHVEPAET